MSATVRVPAEKIAALREANAQTDEWIEEHDDAYRKFTQVKAERDALRERIRALADDPGIHPKWRKCLLDAIGEPDA